MISVASPRYVARGAFSGRNAVYVPMYGSCRIDVSEGSFPVLDADCTDGVATVRLPNPDPQQSGRTSYTVWARALGRLRTATDPSICVDDEVTGDRFCPTESTVVVHGDAAPHDATNALLETHADLDGDGVAEEYDLFEQRLEGYTWRHHGMGENVAELRLYAAPTTAGALSVK